MSLPHNLLFIIGRFAESGSGRSFETINPYNRQPWATLADASSADVEDAIRSARQALDTTWRTTPGVERSRLMARLAELLEVDAARMGLLESTHNGKVIRETRAQMVFAARQYPFFGSYADKLWGSQIPLDRRDMFDYATREPLGVVVTCPSPAVPI